jgi:hypothetical protein
MIPHPDRGKLEELGKGCPRQMAKPLVKDSTENPRKQKEMTTGLDKSDD